MGGGGILRGVTAARWVVGVWLGVVPALVLAREMRPVSAEPRVTMALEHGWRFKQSGELTGAENPAFDDSGWATVDIPHTWNRVGNEGVERSPATNLVQGVGWYRLRFKAPPRGAAPKRYFLQFDGVGAVAAVWLNGHYLGRHAGAFARFRFDATGALDRAGENLLVVKADNSRPQPGAATEAVIPLSGDFFVFGGIYRKVSLVVTAAVHVDLLDYGGPGVYARPTVIQPDAASVKVSARLVNDAARATRVRVEAAVEDATGKVVATATKEALLAPASEAGAGAAHGSAAAGEKPDRADSPRATTWVLDLQVPHPHLWQGTKDPYLYRTVLTVRSPEGAVLDRLTQRLGLRTVAFDPDRGFFLNAEHVFLHGVSMHQDRPVKGWAISDADQEQDFRILADLGGNVVRLAHYQHDQRSYELADELGIVAWAEIPLVNQVSFDGSAASAALTANAIQQLHELIRQNYNHPSIALWSIGNEVDLRATMANGPSQARAAGVPQSPGEE